MSYQPSDEILEKYASVLVNFALGNEEGIKPGETVYLKIPEAAKPLLGPLKRAILQAGGNFILDFSPDEAGSMPSGVDREFFQLASPEQLRAFPRRYLKGLVDEIDHLVGIIAEADPHALDGVDSEKIMAYRRGRKPYMDWRFAKEHAGRLTWVLAAYGTEGMAREADLSLEEYWEQIIRACYLDEEDPLQRWREVARELGQTQERLDRLRIERVHVEGGGIDLWVQIGEGRRWLAGGGRNIPSFEVFTSPDWRGTEGSVAFDLPLYYHGALIEGIGLRFAKGRAVEAHAVKNEALLHSMIAADPGAARLGEFSLTDGRLSRITKFMADTLYDENHGGPQGNFHIALGASYHNTYDGELGGMKKLDWRRLGYNDSVVHTDLVSTTRREVTAYLPGGKKKAIYRDGKFTL